MPNGEHEPGTHMWALGPAVIGLFSAAIGLFSGRRKQAGALTQLDRLSALEQRFERLENSLGRLEDAVNETHKSSAELHREIFELLRAHVPGTQH